MTNGSVPLRAAGGARSSAASLFFPGDAALLHKAEESQGLMCQHPGFPRGGVTLTLVRTKKIKRITGAPF